MATAPISTDSHKFALPHSTLEHAPYQAPQHNSFQPSYATDKVTDDPGTSLTKQTRNPWGLSPLAFGLLIAAISAVIVGAAVGGGVGGALSSNTKSAPTVTITATPTVAATSIASSLPTGSASTALPAPSSLVDYHIAEPYYVSSLDSSCDGSTAPLTGPTSVYDIVCATDYGNGNPSRADSSLLVRDVSALFAYSLLDCIYACDSANRFLGDQGAEQGFKCEAVTWATDMAASNQTQHANCYLKNGTSTSSYQCNNCISAVRRS